MGHHENQQDNTRKKETTIHKHKTSETRRRRRRQTKQERDDTKTSEQERGKARTTKKTNKKYYYFGFLSPWTNWLEMIANGAWSFCFPLQIRTLPTILAERIRVLTSLLLLFFFGFQICRFPNYRIFLEISGRRQRTNSQIPTGPLSQRTQSTNTSQGAFATPLFRKTRRRKES